ncbi:hypothetical protein IP88_05220 [alpha proteobacterium AAP81b]|nr:hypothetical protein IP88_05220 [alpha proteobacterium AAP81b]
MIRLLIADDHPIVLEGLASLLEASDLAVVARCRNGDDALAAITTTDLDIAILDIQMPGPSGLDILRRLRDARAARPKVVILTASFDPGQIAAAIQLEADGLVLKDVVADRIVKCLDAVAAGGQWIDNDALKQGLGELARREDAALSRRPLSGRETEVARLAARGLRNKDIAELLALAPSTVKMHMSSIFEKLDVESRAQLAAIAKDLGLD